MILDKCPAVRTDVPRFQWAWERDEVEHAWDETMLWDCIFIACLWQTNPPSATRDLGGMDEEWRTVLEALNQARRKMEAFLQHMLDLLQHPDKCVYDVKQCMPVSDDCLENLSKCVPSADKCVKDPMSCPLAPVPTFHTETERLFRQGKELCGRFCP